MSMELYLLIVNLKKKEGTPIILLNHFSAVIDNWDPRTIDGIAKEKWGIIFDNRGVGGSQKKIHLLFKQWLMTRLNLKCLV